MSKLAAIVETLAIALREITVARGYNTDIGNAVFTEIAEHSSSDAPSATVIIRRKLAKGTGASRPSNTRRAEGVISLIVPSEFSKGMSFALLAEEDVERRLTVNPPMMPGALPVQLEEMNILFPEPGLPSIIVEIGFSTEYRL